mmetsp:Transcript_7410/g.18611  ORF Transcript_7410/g.18611 Transcript_7410/m.18611 type:complete len:249 (-) Transcript_7410:250-996(-)
MPCKYHLLGASQYSTKLLLAKGEGEPPGSVASLTRRFDLCWQPHKEAPVAEAARVLSVGGRRRSHSKLEDAAGHQRAGRHADAIRLYARALAGGLPKEAPRLAAESRIEECLEGLLAAHQEHIKSMELEQQLKLAQLEQRLSKSESAERNYEQTLSLQQAKIVQLKQELDLAQIKQQKLKLQQQRRALPTILQDVSQSHGWTTQELLDKLHDRNMQIGSLTRKLSEIKGELRRRTLELQLSKLSKSLR